VRGLLTLTGAALVAALLLPGPVAAAAPRWVTASGVPVAPGSDGAVDVEPGVAGQDEAVQDVRGQIRRPAVVVLGRPAPPAPAAVGVAALAALGVRSGWGSVDIVAAARPLPLPLPLPTLPVYNMVPPAGKVSDFAFGAPLLAPRIDIIGGVRDTSDYGVYFTITGGSGDTYLTSGVTPSATATGLGFTAFVAGTLKCNPRAVAWTAYSTAANLVVLRSTNVQLANATSLDARVSCCM